MFNLIVRLCNGLQTVYRPSGTVCKEVVMSQTVHGSRKVSFRPYSFLSRRTSTKQQDW